MTLIWSWICQDFGPQQLMLVLQNCWSSLCRISSSMGLSFGRGQDQGTLSMFLCLETGGQGREVKEGERSRLWSPSSSQVCQVQPPLLLFYQVCGILCWTRMCQGMGNDSCPELVQVSLDPHSKQSAVLTVRSRFVDWFPNFVFLDIVSCPALRTN